MPLAYHPPRRSIVPDSEDEGETTHDPELEEMMRRVTLEPPSCSTNDVASGSRVIDTVNASNARPSSAWTPKRTLRKRPEYPSSPYVYELSPTPPRPLSASPRGNGGDRQVSATSNGSGRRPLEGLPLPQSHAAGGSSGHRGGNISTPLKSKCNSKDESSLLSPSKPIYTPRTPKRAIRTSSANDPFFDPSAYPVLQRTSLAETEPRTLSTTAATSGGPAARVIDLTQLPATPVHRRRRRTLGTNASSSMASRGGVMGQGSGTSGMGVRRESSEVVDPVDALDPDEEDEEVGVPYSLEEELESSPHLERSIDWTSARIGASASPDSDHVSGRHDGLRDIRDEDYFDIEAELAYATRQSFNPVLSQHSDEHSPIGIPGKKSRKKRLVLSSDEDEDGVAGPGTAVKPAARPATAVTEIFDSEDSDRVTPLRELGVDVPIEVLSDRPAPAPARPIRSRAKPRPRAGGKSVSRFIADVASASDSEDDGYSDDSPGSLRDFIVDDDDESEWSEEESPRRLRVNGKNREQAKDWIDSDVVLQYSPPGRLHKVAPGTPSITAIREVITIDDSSDEDIPRPTTTSRPVPRHPAAAALSTPAKTSRAAQRDWAVRREAVADALMAELDETVFRGELVRKHDIKAKWNVKLLTTAGRAHWKRSRDANGVYAHAAHIELSTKVLDTEAKILNTVAHELCHLASFILSGETKNPHGRVFKDWASKIMRVRRDIKITTKHSYEITKKYEWKCTNAVCGQIYGRHSKSIDTDKSRCGRCKSVLEPLFGKPGGSIASAFQTFLKLNMKLAKAALPSNTSHGDLMRCVSERWKAAGATASQAEHEVYWREMTLAGLGGLRL